LANVAAGALVLAVDGTGIGHPGMVAGSRTLSVPPRLTARDFDFF
jgi:hypothetical protein